MNYNQFDDYIFCFNLQNLKIGLFLKDIHRVIRAIEVSPLPGSPEIVTGIINLSGSIIPVINFRKRFNLKNKSVIPSDVLVIVKTNTLDLCFFADEIEGLKPFDKNNFSSSESIIPEAGKFVEGVAVTENEIILIHDINKFLSLEEESKLIDAMNKKTGE